MTAVLEGCEWSAARPGRTYPGKDPVPILQEVGWAPGQFWTGGKPRPHRDSIPDRPGRSPSLYQLNYPPPHIYIYIKCTHTASITHLIHIICNILKLLIILDFKVVSQGKFWKYIDSTHDMKSQHNLLQTAHAKAGSNCKLDLIMLTF